MNAHRRNALEQLPGEAWDAIQDQRREEMAPEEPEGKVVRAVLKYITENPGAGFDEIRLGAYGGNESVTSALRGLELHGMIEVDRSGNKHTHWLNTELPWEEGERVTEDDALTLHKKRVCRDCGERLGHEHAESCPQREET